MEKGKKNLVLRIMYLIIITLICFIITKLWYLSFSQGNVDVHDYSNYIKKLIPLLCTIVVFTAGTDALYTRDAYILKAAYTMICFAELSFFFGQLIQGIYFFALCQLLLIFRHYAGIKEFILRGFASKNSIKLIITSLAIGMAVSVWLIITFRYMFKGNTTFYAAIIYGLILGISLWIAYINSFTEYYPKKNAFMIVTGMLFFFISDFLVGAEVIINGNYYKSVIDIFVWLLYTPAISLIALSNYKYKT